MRVLQTLCQKGVQQVGRRTDSSSQISHQSQGSLGPLPALLAAEQRWLTRAVATEASQLKLVLAGPHAMREKSRAELEWTEEFGEKATEPIPTAIPAESPAKFPPFDPSRNGVSICPNAPLPPDQSASLVDGGGRRKRRKRRPGSLARVVARQRVPPDLGRCLAVAEQRVWLTR